VEYPKERFFELTYETHKKYVLLCLIYVRLRLAKNETNIDWYNKN
jgi:hypothetical protein